MTAMRDASVSGDSCERFISVGAAMSKDGKGKWCDSQYLSGFDTFVAISPESWATRELLFIVVVWVTVKRFYARNGNDQGVRIM